MRNRRLTAVLVIFVVVGTLAILGGAVFTVQVIEVRFENELYALENSVKDDIAGAVSFSKGRNILFGIDRAKIGQAVNSHNNRVRYINAEVRAPNRLVIRVRERYPIYAYNDGGRAVVFDGDMRALGVGTDMGQLDIKDTNPPWGLIDVTEAFESNDEGVQGINVGEGLSDGVSVNALRTLVDFHGWDKSREDSMANYYARIKFSATHMYIYMRGADSAEFHIENIGSRTRDKFADMWQAYNINRSDGIFDGVYHTFETEEHSGRPVPDGIVTTFNGD